MATLGAPALIVFGDRREELGFDPDEPTIDDVVLDDLVAPVLAVYEDLAGSTRAEIRVSSGAGETTLAASEVYAPGRNRLTARTMLGVGAHRFSLHVAGIEVSHFDLQVRRPREL